MTEAPEAIPLPATNPKFKLLPAVFINREGELESVGARSLTVAYQVDDIPFSDQGEPARFPSLNEHTESAAMNRLRRALFETGQLIVTTEDGLSRICFSGVGDPERLFVEARTRESLPPQDLETPGCLCLLPQAEAILRRVYRGESSGQLAGYLSTRVSAFRHGPEAA